MMPRMTFSDQTDFLVLPRKGAAGAVECAVYPPRSSGTGAKAGLVVHLYGHNGSCREYNMMREPYALARRLLWEQGVWLVVPDLGPRHWMGDTACKSLDAVIEGMIQDRGVDPARVNILGTSMGAGSGLVYVMRRPGRVRAIRAVFPVTDFVQWVQETPQYLPSVAEAHGVKPSEAVPVLQGLSPLHHVASFAGVSVFLLHGDADAIIPVHHSRQFAALLEKQDSPVIYREAPGVGHSDEIAAPFQREMVEFLVS